ncbi:MAG TPA: hypothetical protein VNR42_06380 [Solirubrobacteraceae bacterium]|nr:hypothetical protein [Solirubrobacteraceae bacterium]
MFLATALLYPCVLVALCLGAGLLVDRVSGRFLPASLLGTVGAAGLIALSQLTTYVHWFAPATPYLMLVIALVGYWAGRRRARDLLARVRAHAFAVAAALLAYGVALAPVLLAGRPSFSSYMALADSAVHMIGADYLIRHGQDYAHLDLRNSYGQFIHAYYGTSYPSGADTLFGGSAALLRLPLIWAFQPFNALMLAIAVGPAWLLARRLGLDGAWAALAALSAVVPALVYAYELFGSVKEVTATGMILTLGCLIAIHRDWLRGPPTRAIPFALVLAGGASALGAAFGAWGLVATVVLAVVLMHDLLARREPVRSAVALAGCAVAVLLTAAWPTWIDLSGSVRVAQNIASTSNSGNLSLPLRAIQVFGVWLGGSYKLEPHGSALAVTHALVALALLAAALGAVRVLRRRAYALAGWLALMLLTWLAVTRLVTTWGSAKTLMLTSPVVVLLAWGGVAALRELPRRWVAASSASLLALTLLGGEVASDAMQYHTANLAPTARYEELASLGSRFAGQGPTLLTDFDEWSMYALRNLDVGGPDFVYPPPALAAAAGGYGYAVDLDRVSPAALRSYPLMVTRRDPAASRPPAAYQLVWQRSYYQVWRRTPGAAPATAHIALHGTSAARCRQIGRLVSADRRPAHLFAAQVPDLVSVQLTHASRPAGWGRERAALVMKRPGRLYTTFRVPTAGVWNVWVKGQIMPTVELSVDGHSIASVGGQLGGNSLVMNSAPPIPVSLTAGVHRLTVTRRGFDPSPGDGGSAVLDAIELTPASEPSGGVLRDVAVSRWRSLCGGNYEWVELIAG